MARIASTTTAGVPAGPVGGMTLDALMERAKEAAARQGEIAAPRRIGSPWQGVAQLAQSFVNARQGAYAEDQVAQGRQKLVELLSGVNPETGADPATAAQIYSLDPAAGQRAMEAAAEAIRAKRAREQAVADREDTQAYGTSERVAGQEFTGTQNEASRTQQTTLQEDQQAAQVERDKEAARVAAEAAAQAARVDAAKPITGSAQAEADYQASKYGPVGSPEAIARRDAEIAKATALPASGVTVMTGDTSNKLVQQFDTEEGKTWQAYLAAGAKAGAVMNDMQLLDELGKVAPQGPVPGYLQKMFPGVDSAGAAFQSIINRAAPQMRVEGSGSTSDIEYNGMLKSLPSLANYPEANQLIGGMMKAKAQIDLQRADVVTKWRNGEMKDAEARTALMALNRQSIMTPDLQALIANVGPAQGAGAGASTTGTSGDVQWEVTPQ